MVTPTIAFHSVTVGFSQGYDFCIYEKVNLIKMNKQKRLQYSILKCQIFYPRWINYCCISSILFTSYFKLSLWKRENADGWLARLSHLGISLWPHYVSLGKESKAASADPLFRPAEAGFQDLCDEQNVSFQTCSCYLRHILSEYEHLTSST